MPTENIGEVELYYEIEGEGADTVAFINGIGMTVQSWQPIRERFISKNEMVFACAHPARTASPTVIAGVSELDSPMFPGENDGHASG